MLKSQVAQRLAYIVSVKFKICAIYVFVIIISYIYLDILLETLD